MPALAAPLAAGKLNDWEAWTVELTGPRRAAFQDMNSRFGLEEHRAYLQPLPDGNFLVIVVAEGSGADSFLEGVAASDHEFDRWFAESIADLHGMDPGGETPPMAERRI